MIASPNIFFLFLMRWTYRRWRGEEGAVHDSKTFLLLNNLFPSFVKARTHWTESWNWAVQKCWTFSPNLLLWLVESYLDHKFILTCFWKFRTSKCLFPSSAILDINCVLIFTFSPINVLNCILVYKTCIWFSEKPPFLSLVNFSLISALLKRRKTMKKTCSWGVT